MRVIFAVLLVVTTAFPVLAANWEIFPSNRRSDDGVFRGVLDVTRDGRRVAEFRVDRGDIDARIVRDPHRAIAFVVGHFNLSPQRDRVTYCTNGIVGSQCRVVSIENRGQPATVTWP